MAITVRHEPQASTIARAAYGAGLGDWERFQQEQRLKQQQLQMQQQLQYDRMAVDDVQQRRALAAQQQSQFANRQENAADRQLRYGLANQEMQLNVANRQQGREWDVADQERRYKEADEAQNRQIAFAEEQQRMIAERNAEDDRRRRIDAGLKSGEFKYGEPQKLRIKEIDTAIHSATTDRGLTDDERSRKVQQLQVERNTILDNPMPVMPDERPKSLEERFQEETKREVHEDGSVTTYGLDRSDRWREISHKENKMASEAAKKAADMKKAYDDYYKELRKPSGEDGTVMSIEEASRRANEHVRGLEKFGAQYEYHTDDATGYGGYREVPQAQPPAPPPQPEPPPPPPQEQQWDARAPDGRLAAFSELEQPVTPELMSTPPIPEAPQKIGSPVLRRPKSAREAYAEVYKAVPDKEKFAWKKPSSIGEEMARGLLNSASSVKLMAANGIIPPAGVFGPPPPPPPKFDNDAQIEAAIAQHGSGFVFVGPDGKTYVVP